MKTSLPNKLFLCAAALVSGILGHSTSQAQLGGVPLWTNRYSGRAGALAVDGSGNVFVTGSSSGEYATIAYSGAGVPLWTNRYSGPGNSDDEPQAVAVDRIGNVFVTGYANYNNGGNSAYDYATVAYSGAGVPSWTNHYDGPGNSTDSATAVAADASGNVFVTGGSVGIGGDADFATIKYSGSGAALWTTRYSGPGNADVATAMAVDGSGNVFVTGQSLGSGSGTDYATIKYSGAGVPLWTNRYHGPVNSNDAAFAVAVDGSGNVFVTGGPIGSAGDSDYATIKYSGAGVPLWTNRYQGPNGHRGTAMAVDRSGNVFVTGFSGIYATIKYSGAGVPLWTNRYSGPGDTDDEASAVAVDASGNVFVTGYSTSPNVYPYTDASAYATIGYSGAGAPLWTNRYNWPGAGIIADFATDVAVDGSGNVFVTGYSWNGSSYDYATIKYSAIPPSLTIALTPTNTVAVSWPSPSLGFTLQQNANGIATVNWSNVLATPSDDGTTKTLILDPPTGNGFYRLLHP